MSNRFRFSTRPQGFNLRIPSPWVAGRGMPVYIIYGFFEECEFNPFIDYLNSESADSGNSVNGLNPILILKSDRIDSSSQGNPFIVI